jgi:DNA-binding transcriptional regulator YdaS (Cro superfamily)
MAAGGEVPERDLYLRTLRRAADIVGGEQALAIHLKVTPSHLALWLKGLEQPTTEAFLRAVDLVSAHELAQLPQPPPGRAPELD